MRFKDYFKESREDNERLKGLIAKVAQKEYDTWTPEEEGGDEEWGEGGICHEIADSIVGALSELGIDAISMQASVGENHTFVIALMKDGIYNIDVPPDVYEIGSGYNWTKKPGVVISSSDVIIDLITRDVSKWEEYSNEMNEGKMFHGSNVKFDKPKEGMIHWVTPSRELAQEYASGAVVHRKGGEPIVYEHDIDVKHPAIVNDEYSPIMRLLSKWYEARPNKESSKEAVVAAMNAIREKWHSTGLDNSNTSVFNHWNMTGVDGNRLLINFLELLGYDSIYFKEFGHDTYGVWKI